MVLCFTDSTANMYLGTEYVGNSEFQRVFYVRDGI
uniref:Uncharacterized protein n=1 Tax=Nelumbo nucifera TaxID=4432 RepID=A0A822YEK5_NELNU|nr:TPA_asm: hypothetical protein HUJ06_009683 [Nelumbo nucifera]